ncbi:hypothetical protein BUALT_Bualt07G0149200 [Buddleja alternifolia]|uniref:Avr9/Cf-9 rapidly elicited protein 146 n=1 Tax=Buddleja alternifolia TaxID=168488 RepID=A0AAV6XHL3_9LAMI|nr:hypothetical protein BUALT_Bualt07G0149200 [Buddleja alternifolia]
MLRKGISKGKLLADLSMHMMMKRGKIAGKAALQNLISHHSHRVSAVSTSGSRHDFSFTVPLDEDEVSCTNSPAYPSFHLNEGKDSDEPLIDAELMAAALEMINSVAASPALPGFGPSPKVRQLRITDSPFPLRNSEDDNNHVDEAAEEFIMKFYNNLKRQNAMGRS